MGKIYTLKNKRVYSKVNCLICHKSFQPETSRQRICSELCYIKRDKLKEKSILAKFDSSLGSKKIKKLLNNKKYLIKDERTMTYSDSPTGRAFIGVSKRPLQEVKEGFGYKGVLIQTDNRQFVQCHICGKWVKKLTGGHIEKKHKITKAKYQKKFGLMVGNGLVADATSYRYEESGRKKNEKYPEQVKKIQKIKFRPKLRKLSDKIEHQNKYAICEKQLEFRLLSWVKMFKDLPSASTKKGDGRKLCKAIQRRYGSLNEGFKHYGLPVRYRNGSTVELVAPDKEQLFFNYNKFYSKDNIYNWLTKHCSKLQDKVITAFA